MTLTPSDRLFSELTNGTARPISASGESTTIELGHFSQGGHSKMGNLSIVLPAVEKKERERARGEVQLTLEEGEGPPIRT
jgi:hypothetical protein